MSDYQRFISYIYAYDQGIKSRNVGFAKVESRNGRGRFTLNMKGAYGGNGKIQRVYLFRREQGKMLGIYMGEFRIENGEGEFHEEMNVENIKDSGIKLTQMGGIYICSSESKESIYASGWDDHVIRIEDFIPEPPKEIKKEGIPYVTWKVEPEKDSKDQIKRTDNTLKAAGLEYSESFYQNRTEQSQKNTEKTSEVLLMNDQRENNIKEIEEQKYETPSENERQDNAEQEWNMNHMPTSTYSRMLDVEPLEKENKIIVEETINYMESSEEPNDMERQSNYESDLTAEWSDGRQENVKESFWEDAYQQLPKVRAFEEEDIPCLKIDLTDLEKLPRSNWILGNNSFLLHGFYNFRYLLLAKVEDKVIIGVPGMYHRKEQLMAAMFGFGKFKPSQPCEGDMTGRFGYWYQEVQD